MSCRRIWANSIRLHWVDGPDYDVDEQIKDLDAKVVSYGGDVVSVRRQLVADRVIPVWPQPEESCVADIFEFLLEELRDDLLEPARCLLPRDQWPEARPRSKVHASSAEWYSICKAAAARRLFGTISLEEVFTDQFGEPVLNGAMGVDKFKTVNGKQEAFLRFSCILTPIKSFMRKLRGDSHTLPFFAKTRDYAHR